MGHSFGLAAKSSAHKCSDLSDETLGDTVRSGRPLSREAGVTRSAFTSRQITQAMSSQRSDDRDDARGSQREALPTPSLRRRSRPFLPMSFGLPQRSRNRAVNVAGNLAVKQNWRDYADRLPGSFHSAGAYSWRSLRIMSLLTKSPNSDRAAFRSSSSPGEVL